MSTQSRAYQGEDDYQRIRAMLSESCRLADGSVSSPGDISVGDFDWWRFTDDDENAMSSVRLWLDDAGNVVALAWPSDDRAEVIVHPEHREVEEEVISWVEEHQAGLVPAKGEENTLNVWAFDGDEYRTDIFTRHGFQRKDTHLVYRRRSLDKDLPDAPLAEGYAFRDMTGDADIEQRVAVHRSAFHPSKMTVEKHQRVMSSPTYRPDLDTIAIAPDGTYAAFCIVWFDPDSEIGVFEPVGCHADHRQRGLASAVMVENMRRVRALGARTVDVAATGGEPAANRLYESLGFQTVGEIHMWAKTFPSP